ncbi:MAG: fluoride efflux transporter CrcB [Roseburia sp.]|nr:fluoride efflux transporter CrcB [Roseburia sp.]
MRSILFVGLGGAIGAIGRYLISLFSVKGDFPFLTLLTNLLGAILIGVVVGLADSKANMPKNLILFLKTGVCGGFTTFSTFSLESLLLLENGKHFLGSVYIVASVVLCILGVALGKYCSTKWLVQI